MIVSILQLMGFRKSKPVHSRASENSELVHAQANSARRTDVKAKAGSPKVAAKVQGKSKMSAVAVKSTAKSTVKAVKKAPLKQVAKPAAKAVLKSPSKAKPQTKPKLIAKAPAKVVKKVPSKPVAKPIAKKAVNAADKTKAKAKVNAGVKAVAKAVKKPVVKPSAKPVGKTPVAATPKPKNQKPTSKVVTQKVNEVLKRKPEPKAAVASKPQSGAQASAASAAKPVAVAAAPAATPPAALAPKAGRPSSRLVQLTVVGMAQSVASTAAKSSYSQTVALPVIVPSMTMAPKKDPKLANNWKTKPVEQMTDPELLSMPDAEYMNEKQMAVFRLKLSVLKQDILNSASDTTEHLREDTVVVPDPADRATIEEEHALELRTRDRERKLLKKIEQSINRIDAGDYGYCDETGEPIGVGRLLARPTATLSLEAQQRRELKQKMFGD
jgi:DnaK suppressor protein